MSPDVMPVLSKGKHRSPRRGACFMEFASYLAGERWSDRPACTHPVLAAAARSVNDLLSDGARQQIAPLVPYAIGTSDPDEYRSVELSLMCLEHVRSRLRTPSLLVDACTLAARLVRGDASLEDLAHLYAPEAVQLVSDVPPRLSEYAERGAPIAVSNSVHILYAESQDPDSELILLLRTLLEPPRSLVEAEPSTVHSMV